MRPKGTVANPDPDAITVRQAPTPLNQGIHVIVAAHTQDKCNELLQTCLPAELASNEWIERMSPTSYLWALKKATALISDPDLKQELTRILAEAEIQKPRKT